MAYEPLHHKYRPQTFGQLVGQAAIATTLANALQQQRIAPAYLFCGPRGTGKTSSARILAKSLNCLTQQQPHPTPCGSCDVCQAIATGSALDIVEIDAASNTGVDNIRELIERAQFAPVQCRYKVYVIDECLTGDTQVYTKDGFIRIDDPTLKGKQALSYNEASGQWEFRPILRWLDQGEREILEIQTSHRKIRCTGNHLIRTDIGWVAAKDIKKGAKILSPVPVDAELSSTNSAPMGDFVPTLEDTNAFLDWLGPTGNCRKNGQNIKLLDSHPYSPSSELPKMTDTVPSQCAAQQLVILNSVPYSVRSSLTAAKSWSLNNGYQKFPKRDLRGGIWMTVPLASARKEVLKYSSIQKATLPKRTNSSQIGLPAWDTWPNAAPTSERVAADNISTSLSEQTPLDNGCRTYVNTQSPQWCTNSETVVSVRPAGVERVYDIEVDANHNFVANGLLVHNCHMLSTAAFNALLKTLEEPPPQVVFVLATTDPQRVLPTIISRCQRFDFRRIPLEDMVTHLSTIATQETIEIGPEAVRLVAQIAQGGLRDAESLLDQLSLLEPPITVEQVWDLVGAVPERDLLTLVEAISQNQASTVLDQARKLMDRGREPLIVLQSLAGFYRDLLIAKTAAQRQDLVAVTAATWGEMQTLVQGLELSTVLASQHHLRTAEAQVKHSSQPRLWLEVTLMGLLPSSASAASPTPAAASAIQPTSPKPPAPSPPRPAGPPPAPPRATPSPEATPSQPGPPSDASASEAPVHDLDSLWQQIIAVLQPFGTRTLMRQQGKLLACDGHTARIGISSKPLFKMAQGRLSNVEAAFKQVLQRPVEVSLEVLPDAEAASPAPAPPSSPAPPPSSAPPPAQAEPPQSPTNAVPEDAPGQADSSPAGADPWPLDSDLDRAVKSFAQFFNGQIVNLDDDLTDLAAGNGSTGPELPQHEDSFPTDPDDDVPF
ncbi:intein-containing DNA polymerase III subunit gamma/tau [Halomicronema hongdechloris C2206]|uniref:DNA-directed DNA polymerase n=1 Tax=Halomicronema hongdechloris C2206 TaxID=1641165 RepID=A0A1Z3HM32_9CYAN|nr:DNA polymerase III subunit gamma/tau [Halomicronema hongdechloris]ASC71379.1 intein-containing DNA polymerase III subunit gamma/tau [Halomicronema hongdechloris C2206]